MIQTLARALATTTCIIAFATPVAAQTRDFNVPAGSLQTALNAFARQSGRQVIYGGDVRSARSPGVRGARPVEEALNAILAGTGFAVKADRSGALAIVKVANVTGVDEPAESSSGQSQGPDEIAERPADETDIIVTAQRRSERLQDVPVSIIALDEKVIRDRNINSLQDLSRIVPTFKGGSSVGSASARVGIRGLGSLGNNAIEPSVATFIDGVYVARSGSIVGTLTDLAAIEVLSGPQGTLFGRNASVGAINIRTGSPTQNFEGRLGMEAGTGDRYRVDGVINIPLGESTALRLSGLAELNKGYWRDLHANGNGMDNFAVRAALKTDLAPSLTWTLRGDYILSRGSGWPYNVLIAETLTPATEAAMRSRLGGILPDTNMKDNRSNVYLDGYREHSENGGVSSNMALTFGDGFTVQLTDSYRLWNDPSSDGDTAGLPLPTYGRSILWRSESNSHELQFSSPSQGLIDGRLHFVSGLYYFNEDLTQNFDTNFLDNYCTILVSSALRPACNAGPKLPASFYHFSQETESLAGYAQGTFEVVPKLELTLGGRYTHDKKNGLFVGQYLNPVASALQTNETTQLHYAAGRFTYRANIAWHPTRNLMLFGTISTGFKSGGFNSGNSSSVLGQARVFRAELVTNYELGFKFQTPDRMFTLNATAYRMDIEDYQERALVGPFQTIRNVGAVRQQGVELDGALRLSDQVRFNFAGAYLDSRFLSYPNAPGIPGISSSQDLTGKPLTFSPKFVGTVGGEFEQPLANGMRLAIRSDIYGTSKFYAGTAIDGNPFAIQQGYALLSGRITLFGANDRWSIAAFGDNLTDKRYCLLKGYQVSDSALGVRNPTTGTALRCFVAAPRTLGLRAEYKF